MRTIDHIVIHCSATREDRSLTVAELEENHRCRGFRGIGYHYYIHRDGTVVLWNLSGRMPRAIILTR